MSSQSDEDEVLATAGKLVAAFGNHDTAGYFSGFAADANFLFHNVDRLIASRADYLAEWRLWEERDGFRVLSCVSTDRHVKLLGPVAIFTHRVATQLRFGDEVVSSRERETIVFARQADGAWLGVHEHLSIEAA